MQGGISLGMHKVQPLLDQHKCLDCVGIKASAPEWNCVATTWKYSFNGNSRTWINVNATCSMRLASYNSPGILKMSQAMQNKFGNWAYRLIYQWIGLHASKSFIGCLKYSSSSLMEVFSFLQYRAVKDFWGKPGAIDVDWTCVEGNGDGGTGLVFV